MSDLAQTPEQFVTLYGVIVVEGRQSDAQMRIRDVVLDLETRLSDRFVTDETTPRFDVRPLDLRFVASESGTFTVSVEVAGGVYDGVTVGIFSFSPEGGEPLRVEDVSEERAAELTQRIRDRFAERTFFAAAFKWQLETTQPSVNEDLLIFAQGQIDAAAGTVAPFDIIAGEAQRATDPLFTDFGVPETPEIARPLPLGLIAGLAVGGLALVGLVAAQRRRGAEPAAQTADGRLLALSLPPEEHISDAEGLLDIARTDLENARQRAARSATTSGRGPRQQQDCFRAFQSFNEASKQLFRAETHIASARRARGELQPRLDEASTLFNDLFDEWADVRNRLSDSCVL